MEAEVRWFSDSKKIMCFCIFRVLEAFWLSKAVGVRWKRKKKKKNWSFQLQYCLGLSLIHI